jgi:hypothetical protein
MQHGEISKQPENELESGSRAALDHSRRNRGDESSRKVGPTSSVAHPTAERDDFFGEDYSGDGSEASDHDAPEMEDSDWDE